MSHTLKLGFKQNPSGTDDYIDFGGSLNTVSGSLRPGYYLKSYSEGAVRVDSYGRQVRDITINCGVQGSSVANAHFKFQEINRYLQRTRMYLEHFNGNIPAQTDLQWHTGRAATLSFQAQDATKMVYWDILDGVATLPSTTFLAPENNSNFYIEPVTVRITVNHVNRESTVILDQVFPLADFEEPWVITTNVADPAGGGWSTTAGHTLSTTYKKFGTRSLRLNGTATASWTTPTITFPEDCTVVCSFWSRGTVVGGSGNYLVRYQKNGSSTNIVNWTAGHSDADWTQYSSAPIPITAGDTLFMSGGATAGGGTVFDIYLDGVGGWRNPTGGVAPTEFFATGRNYLIPSGNVYGIRGDKEAPFVMGLNWYKRSGAGTNNNPRYFLMGVNPTKWDVDYPLLGLDLRTANGAANNNVYWQTQGPRVTGSPLTGVSTFNLTGPSMGRIVGGQPRKYRAFLVFASFATTSSGAVNVALTLGKDVKTYSVNLTTTPGMSGAATNPFSANYGMYDLGDLLFPRPGNIGIERTFTLSTNDNIKIDFTGGTVTNFFLGGIILIPAEQFIFIDLGTAVGTNSYNPIISNESSAVKVMLAQQTTGTSISTYQASGMLSEVNSFNTSAYYTADDVELEPGDTHFEMFTAEGFNTANGTLSGYFWGYDDGGLQPTIIYAPRNLTGAV